MIFVGHRDFLPPAFCLLAAILQLAMLLSPEIGARTCLCSALLLFVPICGAGSYLLCRLTSKKTMRAVATVVCCVLCLWGTCAMAFRADKYLENVAAYRYNDQYIEKYKAGETEKLVFIMPDNNLYRYILPFDSAYFEFWYKQCHGIDENAEFFYDFIVYACNDN